MKVMKVGAYATIDRMQLERSDNTKGLIDYYKYQVVHKLIDEINKHNIIEWLEPNDINRYHHLIQCELWVADLAFVDQLKHFLDLVVIVCDDVEVMRRVKLLYKAFNEFSQIDIYLKDGVD